MTCVTSYSKAVYVRGLDYRVVMGTLSLIGLITILEDITRQDVEADGSPQVLLWLRLPEWLGITIVPGF